MKEKLLLWSSILAGLQVLTGGAALAEIVGVQTAGLAILVVASLQVSTQFYVRGQVTANENVAAYVNTEGELVAGSATSIPNEDPVEIQPALR